MTADDPSVPRPAIARLQILAGSLLWGTTGTAQALAPVGTQPVSVATVRVVLGGLVLVASATLRSLLRPLPPVAVAAATTCLVFAQLSFFAAVDITGVAVGTVVSIGSAPVAAGLLNSVVRRESPGRQWTIATALGVAGCVLILLGGRSVEVDPAGVVLALIVGCGYAGYTLATKDLVERHPPDAVIALVFGLSAACMVPLLFFVDLGWTTDFRGVLIAAHLGLVTIALAYSLYSRGLSAIPAPVAVTLTLAEPVTAAILGIAVLDEPVSGWVAAGMGLVLGGLLLLTVPERNRG